MKMYILILDDLPNGHAINGAAHAALACYIKYGYQPEFQDWLKNSFKKVTCKVSKEEFTKAMSLESYFTVMTESSLGGRETCVAFMPRETWDPLFKTFQLWK